MLTKPLVPYDFCSCVPISLQACENFADGSFAALEKTIARLYHCCSAGFWAKHVPQVSDSGGDTRTITLHRDRPLMQ